VTRPSIAAGASQQWSESLVIPLGTDPNVYDEVVVVVDPSGAISESNEANNSYSITLPITDNIDLAPQSVTPLAGTVDVGQSLTVTGTIANLGPAVAAAFPVAYYLSRDASTETPDDDVMLLAETEPSLGAYASTPFSKSLAIDYWLSGDYYVVVRIANGGKDTNWANNARVSSTPVRVIPEIDLAPTPDLVYGGDAELGSTIMLPLNLTNRGRSPVGDFGLDLYLSPWPILDGRATLLKRTVQAGFSSAASDAGSTVRRKESVAMPAGLSPGAYYVIAVADPGNLIFEKPVGGTYDPEANNTAVSVYPIQLVAPGQPNRAPVNQVPGPQQIEENSPLVFSPDAWTALGASDPGVGGDYTFVRVTLVATHGIVKLGSTTDLVSVIGNETSTVVITDLPGDIARALSGAQFVPYKNFAGYASLGITTNDLGHGGPALPLEDSDAISIEVTPRIHGPLDPNFGADGMVRLKFGQDFERGNAVAIQPDGKIVAAGYARIGEGAEVGDTSFSGRFVLARYNADGTLDAAFGSGGTVTTRLGTNFAAEIMDLAIQPWDGKIVAAGRTAATAENINGVYNDDFALARYNPDGTLDTTFGTGGIVTTPIGQWSDRITSVAIQPDGKIVVAGIANFGGAADNLVLARYLSNGAPDPSFGPPRGWANYTGLGYGTGFRWRVAVQPTTNRLVVAGAVFADPWLTRAQMVVMRTNADGTFDRSFGYNGATFMQVPTHPSLVAAAIHIQPNGTIITAGGAGDATVPNAWDFAVARFQENGWPDYSFDYDGVVTT